MASISFGAPNSQVERLRRYIELAQAMKLTVHGFEIRGRDIVIHTQPIGGAPVETEEDEATRWLRLDG